MKPKTNAIIKTLKSYGDHRTDKVHGLKRE